MLYEIVEAVAHPDHTVTITWSDGAQGTVDFLPIIDRVGWFTPLRDPDYFVQTMILLPGGAGLTWMATPRIQLDAGVDHRLQGDASRWLGNLGVSVYFGR